MSEDENNAQKVIDPRTDKKAKPTYWYDWVDIF